MDKYRDNIIYRLFIPLCILSILVVLIVGFVAYPYDNDTIAISFSVAAIIVGIWQYIVSKYEQEKRERKLTKHTLKQEKCRDILSKIDQLHNKISDFHKRLHDVSIKHSLITVQSNHATDDLVRNVSHLMYDIQFLYLNQINVVIPACLESEYTELHNLKSTIKRSLKQTYNELHSYHSYLISVQNTNNASTHRSSPPTMSTILFDEIHRANSDFHKQLYTIDSYLTFPS